MQILGAKKKHALSRGTIGCVGEVATLNVTRGCAAACAFCYARCYPGAPGLGTVLLYQDLPGQLRQELDSRRRKRPVPRFVVFGTACDPFIGSPAVQQVTRACLEILLRRDVGVSLTTRGTIPEEVVELLGKHAALVRVTVPLASVDESYTGEWEAQTASPAERMFLIQRLHRVGIRPWIRIEPVIPFVNDGNDELRALVSAIVGLGIKHASASFLQLRPGVAEQIARDAPATARRLVLGCFGSVQAGEAARFEHLPERQALAGLQRLQRIAMEYGARVVACACQNPGLPAGKCPVVPPSLPAAPRGLQSELFDSDGAEAGAAAKRPGR